MKATTAKKVGTTRVTKDKTRKIEEKDIKKRKAVLKEAKPKKTRKSKKATKDPNQPKRPPTPFFLFLEQFRKTFKEDHPEVKGVAMVGKASGEKWKEMSEFEKAPFITKAQQKRQDYDKDIAAYYKQKQDDKKDEKDNREESDTSMYEINDDDDKKDGTPEESDKSKSEINDDDDKKDDKGTSEESDKSKSEINGDDEESIEEESEGENS